MISFCSISRILGRYFLCLTLILCIPLAVAITYEFFLDPLSHPQTHSSLAFFSTLLITGICALIFLNIGKKAPSSLLRKESILLVIAIWFLTPAIGALPFIFTKTLTNPLDAYFESMSGLTTTGSTIFYPKSYDPQTGKEVPITLPASTHPELSYTFYGTISPIRDLHTGTILHTGLEAVGKGILFWRSFLQWLGGMGIVVLFIAVLPALLMGGKFLFETEVPGPDKEALTPRIKQTASLLWKIYLGLTVVQITLLMSTNSAISLFDACTLSFSTISTGGFSTKNAGLAAYHNFHTDWIIMLFMVLGSLNFSLYFHCMRGKIYRIYQPEFFLFLLLLLSGCLIMSLNLWGSPKILFKGVEGIFSLGEAVRYGSFQAISAQTSTGFAIADYLWWPFSCQMLLLILVFIGGMAGSTTGGIKIARLYILFRVIAHKIESIFRPYAVRCLKVGDKEISDKTAGNVLLFFSLIVVFTLLGTFLLVLDHVDPQTALGIIACMINNAGLSLGALGTSESCAFLPPFSKIVSILWMALGRLEFFSLLVLLVPSFWRSR